MNRRTQGRVKQARKRAQKRIDIRAGRILSMRQLIHNTHNHVEPEVAVEETPVVTGTHQLVNKETGEVIATGSEGQMRRKRVMLMATEGITCSVHKVKVPA